MISRTIKQKITLFKHQKFCKQGNDKKRTKTETKFLFQANQDHYTFQKLGYAIISNDRAHVVIPVSLKPLQKQMDRAHALCSRLRNSANQLGDDSRGGLTIKGLSYSCDSKYKVINDRFATTIFFMTQNSPYNSESVLQNLNDCTIPLHHLIPDKTFNDPNFDFSCNFLRPQYMKKGLETPDDANEEDSESSTESNAEGELVEEEEGSDLDPADPSWKDLFQRQVDLSGEEEDPEDFSLPFSQDLVQEIEEANRIVKRSVSQYYSRKRNPVTLNRPTRQAFLSLVFCVLASVGVTTIYGGVTSSQIKSVQSEVNNLVSKQTIIVAQLSHNSKEILVNRAFSEGLKNLTIKSWTSL